MSAAGDCFSPSTERGFSLAEGGFVRRSGVSVAAWTTWEHAGPTTTGRGELLGVVKGRRQGTVVVNYLARDSGRRAGGRAARRDGVGVGMASGEGAGPAGAAGHGKRGRSIMGRRALPACLEAQERSWDVGPHRRSAAVGLAGPWMAASQLLHRGLPGVVPVSRFCDPPPLARPPRPCRISIPSNADFSKKILLIISSLLSFC